MRLEAEIARLEDWQRRDGRPRRAEEMTDAELEAVIRDALGVEAGDLSDELLERVAGGE